jgi:hypothetical protein
VQYGAAVRAVALYLGGYQMILWRKGPSTITYLAGCTVAGVAIAPPAKVESMYDPENFALSASRVVTTK